MWPNLQLSIREIKDLVEISPTKLEVTDTRHLPDRGHRDSVAGYRRCVCVCVCPSAYATHFSVCSINLLWQVHGSVCVCVCLCVCVLPRGGDRKNCERDRNKEQKGEDEEECFTTTEAAESLPSESSAHCATRSTLHFPGTSHRDMSSHTKDTQYFILAQYHFLFIYVLNLNLDFLRNVHHVQFNFFRANRNDPFVIRLVSGHYLDSHNYIGTY